MIRKTSAVFVLLFLALPGNAFAQTAPSTQMMMQQTVDTIKKGAVELKRKAPLVSPCEDASNAEGRAKPCKPAEGKSTPKKSGN